jgi:hypothetical protein
VPADSMQLEDHICVLYECLHRPLAECHHASRLLVDKQHLVLCKRQHYQLVKGDPCALLRRAMQGYAVLEAALADRKWLINDTFSAADIMIGTSVRYLHSLQLLDGARCGSAACVPDSEPSSEVSSLAACGGKCLDTTNDGCRQHCRTFLCPELAVM